MKDEILRRGPDGRMVGWGSALSKWLPVLLSATPRCMDTLLREAARHCQTLAQDELRYAATALQHTHLDAKPYWVPVRMAEKWMTKRDIIMETINRLEEVDRA